MLQVWTLTPGTEPITVVFPTIIFTKEAAVAFETKWTDVESDTP